STRFPEASVFCLSLSWNVTLSPTDQIKIPAETGQTGQPVTLPCKLASSSQVIVVQWSRTDLGSDYVLLYRDGRIDPFNQHPSFKNRVNLQSRNMEDGDVSLVLKDVRTEDGGTYECRVVQTGTGRKKNLISTISLEVAAPLPGESDESEPPDAFWVLMEPRRPHLLHHQLVRSPLYSCLLMMMVWFS
uniref:Ig-like domain-containing protein n=1 Tax=Cyprinodon variegatus TaxID=28743 RepID=A0A3Q2DHC2_CYPVA